MPVTAATAATSTARPSHTSHLMTNEAYTRGVAFLRGGSADLKGPRRSELEVRGAYSRPRALRSGETALGTRTSRVSGAFVLDRVLGPRPVESESPRTQSRRAMLWGLAAVALISALVAVVMLVSRGGSTPSAPAPASASAEPEARTNPAPATERPIRGPAPPVPQPAPTSVSPLRTAPAGAVPPTPVPSTTPGTVLVYYAADDDQKTADDLAAALRASINDPRYAVRSFKTARGIGSEGEIRYSSSRLSTLAGTLATSAGSWLSRTYGRRVAFTPTVEPRVTATGVIVIMPGRTAAPAMPLVDPVVIIVYPASDDPKMAADLANFLGTLRSGWKYTVRTTRATTGPRKEGQIEYDNERMGTLAEVLARDPAAWISRAYGRRVVLQPTLTSRIGANTVVLWLPSR